jgi:F-box interacting protein
MLWFGFGYDNSTDTYKVVVLSFNKDVPSDLPVRPKARVFTFGDNIWRDIKSFPVVVLLHRHNCFDEQNGVYLSNSTNWLVRSQYNCRLKNLTIEQFVIISLDLGTETYTKFLLPRCCDEVPLDRSTLCVLMDCLCFSYNFKNTHLVLWKMKEFGVEESWTQFLKISYLNLQVKVYCFMDTGYVSHLTPLCLSENGDTLIFAVDNSKEAILYDLRNNRVKRTVNTDMIKMCTVNGYFESLLSTC